MTEKTVSERFSRFVDSSGGPDACWPWKGSVFLTRGRYGRFKLGGRVMRANRVALELHTGQEIGSLQAQHSCDNPTCCNPAHLSAGDAKKNARDARDRGRLHDKRNAGGRFERREK